MCLPISSRSARIARTLRALVVVSAIAQPMTAAASVAPMPIRSALQAAWQAHPTSRATDATIAAARARQAAAGRPVYNPEIDLDVEREGPDRSATAGISMGLDLGGKRTAR